MTTSTTALRFFYDRLLGGPIGQDFFEGSGFCNVGWWSDGARSPREASLALMARLTANVPPGVTRVLDAACGIGATSAWLAAHFPTAAVVALDLAAPCLAHTTGMPDANRPATKALERDGCPTASALSGDAGCLPLGDGTFDLVVCVEGAYHVRPRERFLAEARRVLRPGGRLVLADPAFDGPTEPDTERYGDMCRAAGFAEVNVVDAIDDCVAPFRRALAAWAAADPTGGTSRRAAALLAALPATAYLLVDALRGDDPRRRP